MTAPIVELRNVWKVYATEGLEVTALRDVSLAIGEGEYAVIMGASGSGKSTLLNVLGCLDRLSRGRYLLGGQDVSDLDDDMLSALRSRKLGFIFQSYNLIPQLNVLENIEAPLYYQDVPERDARRRAADLAERLGLGDRIYHKPAQLSGGQQQRVAIARSLASAPLLLLADEPTGNLDSKTGEEILRIIDELNAEGRTIIMVTHDDAVAHRAHRVVRLLDGGIQSDEYTGSPGSLELASAANARK
ncbi:MAG TPA: ABC transporter ATP-binding protein [Sumerlaeia bacterium]|nr:ABC transporter ATP-binding protein [Sumerlaeia bacterium]